MAFPLIWLFRPHRAILVKPKVIPARDHYWLHYPNYPRKHITFSGGGGLLLGGKLGVKAALTFSGGGGLKIGGNAMVKTHLLAGLLLNPDIADQAWDINPATVPVTLVEHYP